MPWSFSKMDNESHGFIPLWHEGEYHDEPAGDVLVVYGDSSNVEWTVETESSMAMVALPTITLDATI